MTPTMLFMGVIRRKRHLLFSYKKSKFKGTFLFPSFCSEQWTFPHHCGWESTFKIWFINGAGSSINSSSIQPLWAVSEGVTEYWCWPAASDSMASSQPFCCELEGVPEGILQFFCISTFIAAQDLLQSLHVQLVDTKGYAFLPLNAFIKKPNQQ